jgi:Zn-dependent protease
MALLLALVAQLAATSAPAFSDFAGRGVFLSLYLALFNLLPVPPLDGSKLLLAARVPVVVYQELSRFGFVLLIVAMSASGLGRWLAEFSWLGAAFLLGIFG